MILGKESGVTLTRGGAGGSGGACYVHNSPKKFLTEIPGWSSITNLSQFMFF